MKPFAIVNVFDENGQTPNDVIPIPIIHQVDFLGLEGLEKTLDLGVLVGVALRRHAAPETVGLEKPNVLIAGILHASVRVVNTAPLRSPRLEGAPKRRERQSPIHRLGEGITDDLP